MSKINIESIKKGDRVKVSLHGLPESDWLEVSAAFPSYVGVIMPNGRDRLLTPSEITAHEPATPELPDWWGSKVIKVIFYDGGQAWYPYDEVEDDYVGVTGMSRKPEFFEGLDVTVIVDRDGNQPAVDKMRDIRDWVIRDREEVAAERDEWQFRFEAFRAEVAKVRDDLRNVRSTWGADRLTAILDGDDQ